MAQRRAHLQSGAQEVLRCSRMSKVWRDQRIRDDESRPGCETPGGIRTTRCSARRSAPRPSCSTAAMACAGTQCERARCPCCGCSGGRCGAGDSGAPRFPRPVLRRSRRALRRQLCCLMVALQPLVTTVGRSTSNAPLDVLRGIRASWSQTANSLSQLSATLDRPPTPKARHPPTSHGGTSDFLIQLQAM